MAEYRIYTLDAAKRIVGCQGAACSDDRHAFIVSSTLGDTGAELEIWQDQRFVGRSTRQPAPGRISHRLLTTTVGHRDASSHVVPGPGNRPAAGLLGQVDAHWFVAIGASGSEGLGDIVELLDALAKPVRAVVMVVLHRPRDRISHLQQVLARRCGMPVAIAGEGERFVPGTCYIGEPDSHLTVMGREHAHLIQGAQDRLRNRTIDTLFHSLAACAGSQAIGIVLSGSLDDGSRGLAAIHAAHGLTMVLDPGAKPRGMQQNAIDHDGPISFVGTAAEIARTVDRLAG